MFLTYKIVDMGVVNVRFFPGVSAYGTQFDRAVAGVGDSAREAGETALAAMGECVDLTRCHKEDVQKLREEIAKLDDVVDRHQSCAREEEEGGQLPLPFPHECDMQHIVALYWLTVMDPQVDPVA